ncbi:MAG: hypothetical protein AB8G23_14890 [Myxococcota bacterium]
MSRGGGRSRRPEKSAGLQQATLHLGQRTLQTGWGDFEVHFFRDLAEDRTAMAIVRGDVEGELQGDAPLLVRVHSSCLTSECLLGCDCDCVEQLAGAMARIAEAGRGIVFYLMQEGRGAGLSAKARDRMIVQASENRVTTFEAYAAMGLASDLRRYDAVASMAKLLGVRGPIQLLTNNPEKARAVEAALVAEKVEVCGTEPIYGAASSFNRDYLRAKQATGHMLTGLEADRGVLAPERVRVFEPVALRGDPGRVVTASYFLPVVFPAPAPALTPAPNPPDPAEAIWFRMSVIFERATARELIWLSRDGLEDPAALVLPSEPASVLRLGLFDRMPRSPRPQRETLVRALMRIRDGEESGVLLHCDERWAAEGSDGRADDDASE